MRSGFDAARSKLVERREFSDVYENADGTRTARIGRQSRNVQGADGVWRPVDTALTQAEDGSWRPGAHPLSPRLAAQSDAERLMTLSVGGGSVSLGLLGAAGRPGSKRGKSGLRYRGVGTGLDLDYEVTPGAVKETLIVADSAALPVGGWTFRMRTDGLSPRVEPDGSVVLRTGAGEPVLTIPPVFAWDSAGSAGTAEASTGAGSWALQQDGVGAWRLTLKVDMAWATDPARVFPLNVDPTVAQYASQDERAYRSDGASCTACGLRTGNARVGNLDTHWRTVARFNFDVLFGKQVLDAQLAADLYSGSTGNFTTVLNHAGAFAYSGMGEELARAPFTTSGVLRGTPSNAMALKDKLAFWVNNRVAGAQLMLRGTETPGLYTYKDLDAVLQVTYNNKPTVGVAVAPSPANGATKVPITSTLKVSAADPENDPLEYYFRVGSATNPDVDTKWSSGWSSSNQVTIPFDKLQGGMTYGWKVFVRDDLDEGPANPSQTASTWVNTFKTNVPAPVVPDGSLGTTPGDKAVVANTTPLLTVSPVSPLESGDTVKYRFYIGTGTDPRTGRIIDSGWLDSPQFVPPPGSLQDGGQYRWTVSTGDFDSTGRMWDEAPAVWSRQLTINLRVGEHGPAPVDSTGPVTVNLANGNGSVTAGSPAQPTVGGDIALSYTYNTQAEPERGLRGEYFVGYGTGGLIAGGDAPSLVRLDPTIDFNWSTDQSPYGPAVGLDNYRARWTGFLTAPATGTYQFGASHDDATRITVNGVRAYDKMIYPGSSDVQWGSTSIALTAGTSVPITIEYAEKTGAAYLSVFTRGTGGTTSPQTVLPTSWLSPAVRAPLPDRWTTAVALAGAPGYVRATVTANTAVITDASGAAHTWTRATSAGAGSTTAAWTPPASESGTLSATLDGSLTLTDQDGTVTVFDKAGEPVSVTGPLDSGKRASAQYTYGTGGRLSSITDPVSGRSITLNYAGDSACVTRTGFAPAPAGMLCRVAYWTGSATEFGYNTYGQLARIIDPGLEITDFGYSDGLLSSVRDPLAADWVSADVAGRASLTDTITTIGYSGLNLAGPWKNTRTQGKRNVVSVTLPAPVTGQPRPRSSYAYVEPNATQVSDAGLSPASGFVRRVTFDDSLRALSDTDAMGVTTSQTWSASDQILSAVDGAGRRTTTVYDPQDRPTDTYGPASASCFTSGGLPTTLCASTVPRSSTSYDGGIVGLASTWFPTSGWTGPPALFGTGTGTRTDGVIAANWFSGGPAGLVDAAGTPKTDYWSVRFAGEISFPETGSYQFRLIADDTARLFIDDTLVVDTDTSSTAGTTGVTGSYLVLAGSMHRRIRLDYSELSGSARLEFRWTPPGGAEVQVPGVQLKPRYDLPTVLTTFDSAGTSGAPTETVTNAYAKPETGLATSVTDAAGLTTSTAYDDLYRRRTGRTLPAGNSWAYTYYAPAEMRTNPCPGASTTAQNQGGQLKTATGPVAADGSRLIEETVYDSFGRVVASRTGTSTEPGSWTCSNYDSRGRTLQDVFPAWAATPARSVTYDHNVGGDPLTSSVTDPAGTITTVSDLLGRVVRYTDVHGTVTSTSYDQAGRATSSSTSTAGGDSSVLAYSYDDADRLELVEQQLAGVTATLADPAYNTAGELSTVNYGNGSRLASSTGGPGINRNPAGAITGLGWLFPDNTTVSDAVTRSRAGRVLSANASETGQPNRTAIYTYDTAARLSTATLPGGRTVQYGFAATGGCGTLTTAGKNTNRTSETVTVAGSTTSTTSCYDNADRLTSTTGTLTLTPAYDSRGNTTTIGNQSLGYDSADRHIRTAVSTGPLTTTIDYARDAADRIISRSSNLASTVKYSYSTGADTADLTLSPTGTLLERQIALPGGVLLTQRGTTAGGTDTTDVWSHPNIHGDITALTNGTGTRTGPTRHYDPYGQALDPATGQLLASTDLPDTSAGGLDYAWLGQHQRPTEHLNNMLATIEMGARQYLPALGRFITVDPVEGGSANDYDYVDADPANVFDLSGECPWCAAALVAARVSGKAWRGVSRGGKWVSSKGYKHLWGPNGRLFGSGTQGQRKGWLNRGPVRTGWGWKGSRTQGGPVLRTAIGWPKHRAKSRLQQRLSPPRKIDWYTK